MRLVIYHAPCWDGFCCAWLARQVWPDAEFVGANYGWDPPDVKGKDVLIADFSYPRDVLIKMKAEANSLKVLDHHATAQQDLNGLDFCTFDMNKSGGQLTWSYLWSEHELYLAPITKYWPISHFDKEQSHWIVGYTGDRDLWNFKLPDSKAINAALRSYPLDFEWWDALSKEGPGPLIEPGRALLRYQAEIINHHVKYLQEVTIPHGTTTLTGLGCACSIAHMWSEIMEVILAKNESCPFAVIWCDTVDGVRLYSLRSRTDIAGTLAQQFGGGGHNRASGFKIPFIFELTGTPKPIHTKLQKSEKSSTQQ